MAATFHVRQIASVAFGVEQGCTDNRVGCAARNSRVRSECCREAWWASRREEDSGYAICSTYVEQSLDGVWSQAAPDRDLVGRRVWTSTSRHMRATHEQILKGAKRSGR